jgi:type IV pilus assembly protein PilB
MRLRSVATRPEVDDDTVAPPAPSRLNPSRAQLGEILLERRAITPGQLSEALLALPGTEKRLGELLVEKGSLDEAALAEALAEQLGTDVIDLGRETPQPEAVERLPEAVARELVALPIGHRDGTLEVAIGDPRPDTADRLSAAVHGAVRLRLAPTSAVRRAIDRSYRATGGIDRFVSAFISAGSHRQSADPARVESTAGDGPVAQVVTLLVTQALRDRASDVHLEPSDGVLVVRFRIDGALHDVLSLPAAIAGALVSRIKILAGMNIVERRRPQDGQFTTEVDGRGIDVRVSTMATVWGEKCVLRVLDKSRSLYRLGELGMPADTHEQYGRMVRSPFGMVLCAGPTGSGKTTTLYATLSEIDERQRNIVTIEDPVEYIFPSINQVQTNDQAGITFADGLRAILRQDPDVILVGEIRDVDTARTAVQSALTGHFVLSSVHSTDSVAALHRFLDMGIEAFLVASSVLGVVSQRLVRRMCPGCRVPYHPTHEELSFYEESGGQPKDRFWTGEGCNFCAGTGYQDRIGVYELLRVTPEIQRLLVGWATQEELRRMATSQGMRTLREEGIALVAEDVTTIAEVIRSIYAL